MFLLSAAAQSKLTGSSYTHWQINGLCSTVFRFENDSMFTSNHGCEGPGHTYYGRYRIKSDSLFLEHGIKDTALKIVKIDSSRHAEKLLVIRFFDQNNINVSKRFRGNYFRSNSRKYGFTYDSLRQALTAPELGIEEVHISTLEWLGLDGALKNADFNQGLTVNYYLHLPSWIAEKFLNKDIIPRGNSVMLIKQEQLIPLNPDEYSYSDQPVIYQKDQD